MFILHEVMEIPWDLSQINAYIKDLEKALRDERIHAVCRLRSIYAQKPLSSNGVQH